jgi:hypothetical protein
MLRSDPGSGAFLAPGSRISDPGSQAHIFKSLVTIFWVKSTKILGELAKKNFIYLFKNKIIPNFVKLRLKHR